MPIIANYMLLQTHMNTIHMKLNRSNTVMWIMHIFDNIPIQTQIHDTQLISDEVFYDLINSSHLICI